MQFGVSCLKNRIHNYKSKPARNLHRLWKEPIKWETLNPRYHSFLDTWPLIRTVLTNSNKMWATYAILNFLICILNKVKINWIFFIFYIIQHIWTIINSTCRDILHFFAYQDLWILMSISQNIRTSHILSVQLLHVSSNCQINEHTVESCYPVCNLSVCKHHHHYHLRAG